MLHNHPSADIEGSPFADEAGPIAPHYERRTFEFAAVTEQPGGMNQSLDVTPQVREVFAQFQSDTEQEQTRSEAFQNLQRWYLIQDFAKYPPWKQDQFYPQQSAPPLLLFTIIYSCFVQKSIKFVSAHLIQNGVEYIPLMVL